MKQIRDLRIVKTVDIKISILSGALFFLSFQSYSQDSLRSFRSVHPVPDTSQSLKDTYAGNDTMLNEPITATSDSIPEPKKDKWLPQPHRATILSAVLPGLGQAYNRKYWKIPIVYAAGGVIYYYYKINNDAFLENKKLYELEAAKGTNANTTDLDKYKREYNNYLAKRDYKALLFGVLYIANIVDAMADAYFASYDISDNLAFKFRPSLSSQPYLFSNTISYGITLSLHF